MPAEGRRNAMTATRSTVWKRALVVLAAMGVLTALGVTPAYAGDAGRNCRTYYFHNDASSGWGFTVCVKLEHDTTNHQWRANGSVTTSTTGVILKLAETTFQADDGYAYRYGTGGPGSSSSPILGITTPWWPCDGVHHFLGWVEEKVTWPNGATSSDTFTQTLGNDGVEGVDWIGSC